MKLYMIMIAGAAVLPAGAAAQEGKPVAPVVASVLDCRGQTEAEARLRCFDQATSALDQAVRSGGLVALDRNAVRTTRRSLFGFNVNLPFFGGGEKAEDEPEEAKQIDAVVRSARAAGFENWQLELDTGAVWQTTEATPKLGMPRTGDKVTIRKSAAGGYMLDYAQRRIRAKRVR
jgi:hypothetical protein